MESRKPTILAVDDDVVNLEIIQESFADLDYGIVTAADGEQAWALLREDPDRFDAVLLDRMMPKMSGMALLALMQADPALKSIPVILQTAAASTEAVREGLSTGAYYYLTKPYEKPVLLAIVRSAIEDYAIHRHMRAQAQSVSHAFTLLTAGRFRFRTLAETRSLATLIAGVFPVSEQVGVGIYELMLNAVEHGNLGITYREKSALLNAGRWEQEVARRLAMPEYAARYATVSFDRQPDSILLVIQDQGAGFDWRPYLEFTPERAYDVHGRGIAMAHQLGFTSLEYRGNGNEVVISMACPERAEPDVPSA